LAARDIRRRYLMAWRIRGRSGGRTERRFGVPRGSEGRPSGASLWAAHLTGTRFLIQHGTAISSTAYTASKDLTGNPEGRIMVDVHQILRDKDGSLLDDRMVRHVYTISDGLVIQMDVSPY
jgi:hypothetical protein